MSPNEPTRIHLCSAFKGVIQSLCSYYFLFPQKFRMSLMVGHTSYCIGTVVMMAVIPSTSLFPKNQVQNRMTSLGLRLFQKLGKMRVRGRVLSFT